ncbi:MAG: DUF4998 domain-containing protein [Marinifilaceae bacterium]
MKGQKIFNLLLLIIVTMVGCESLEDTYKDFSGDGMIRYLGGCSEVEAIPGWRKLNLVWQIQKDPMISSVKISWRNGNLTNDTIVEHTVDTLQLSNLLDGIYEIEISTLDKDNNSSSPYIIYARAFTPEHENVRAFTRGVSKHFFVANNMFFTLDRWQKSISYIHIHYTHINGTEKVFNLKDFYFESGFAMISDVDVSKPVSIVRKGTVEGCVEPIEFEPIYLEKTASFTSDFKKAIKERYGIDEITESWINSREDLELDYSISTLEDILYFPNLKKVVFGKNRYLHPDFLATNEEASKIDEDNRSLSIRALSMYQMWMAMDREDENAVVYEQYNRHYIPEFWEMTDYKGNPTIPVLNYLDTENWTIKNSVEDGPDYDSEIDNLLDGDPMTTWEVEAQSSSTRMHQLVIDMKKEQTISGFQITQKTFDPKTDKTSARYLPKNIKIQVSTDQVTWKNATYVENNTLGNTNGEITLLPMSQPQTVRYIRLSVSDLLYGSNFAVKLADIRVY